MDKKEEKAFRIGVLSGVTGNAIWYYVLLAGGAVLGFLPTWLHGLTDFEQAIIYTLSAVILFAVGVAAGYRYLATRKRKHSLALDSSAPSLARQKPGLDTHQKRLTVDTSAREAERLRVVLRGLSVEQLQGLADLLEGPKSAHTLDMVMMELGYCGLVETLGPGSKIGETVFALCHASETAVREHFKGLAAKGPLGRQEIQGQG